MMTEITDRWLYYLLVGIYFMMVVGCVASVLEGKPQPRAFNSLGDRADFPSRGRYCGISFLRPQSPRRTYYIPL